MKFFEESVSISYALKQVNAYNIKSINLRDEGIFSFISNGFITSHEAAEWTWEEDMKYEINKHFE